MKKNHFILGLLTGAISGAVYGLLNTKYSGAENRAYFKKYSQRVKNDFDIASQDFKKLSSVLANIQNEGIPKAQIFQNELKHSLSELEKEAQPRQRRIQSQLEDIQSASQKL